tara:strand:+ start:371 stop:841 length:471 start_codon:yes stop_codon:yes gene_type:complete
MFHKFLKVLFLLSLLGLYQGCGYQPLLTEKYQKFSVKNFNIDGDKKLGQILANNFNKIENSENDLIFNIKATKKKDVSSRSSIGTATEYTVNVSFNLNVVSENNNEKIFSQNFSQNGTYKASTLHIDTLRREKKIVDNIIKNIAEQITNRLNTIYK